MWIHHQLGLFLSRICTAAWVGAASLFVVVGVLEVTRGGFDSTTKDMLVAIRFPVFYLFGAVTISLGLFGTFLIKSPESISVARRSGALILLFVALLLMVTDYVLIYQPLLKMVTPPGSSKSASFIQYHQASKWINFAGLAVCCFAMTLVNWPANRSASDKTSV